MANDNMDKRDPEAGRAQQPEQTNAGSGSPELAGEERMKQSSSVHGYGPSDPNQGKLSVDPESPSNLIDLYRDWVGLRTSRTDLYRERIDAAWDSLLFDIDQWSSALGAALDADARADEGDRLALHHVIEFGQFAQGASAALDPQRDRQRQVDGAELEDFRALVIGVLTAQWLLVRDVVLQRTTNSPYREGLRQLDKTARGYYARLYDVFDKTLVKAKIDKRHRDDPLASFAPLVYLGNIAQLTVFNRRVPLMLSIPFGALPHAPYDTNIAPYDKNIGMAIPHEVAHAIFAQVPELIDEIKRKLREQLDNEQLDEELDKGELDKDKKPGLSRRERVLYDMAIEWTNEICADLLGTALVGETYADSARWVMAGSDSLTGVTDEGHPPSILRPMIHLLALSAIEKHSGGTKFTETRRFFEGAIRRSPERIQILGRQFRSVPALMFVPIGTVSDVLIDLVERLLFDLELDVLGGKGRTMAWLLSAVNDSTTETLPRGVGADEFEHWAEIPENKRDEFVLDFQANTAPTYATPGVLRHPDCCVIWFLQSLCC